jgi:Ion channel
VSLQSIAAYALVIAATLLTVAACVLLQYELLVLAWRRLSAHTGHRRVKVLYGIFSVLLIHLLEIVVFGAVLYGLTLWPATGALAGEEASTLFDYLYFSAVTFSTVGFGETWPTGAVRFLCAMEALAGFVLITWSASFTYLEMERFWRSVELEKRGE